ncbi:hypothetical protein BD626DRAFT_634083, partial [Schizophyllum amplum]
ALARFPSVIRCSARRRVHVPHRRSLLLHDLPARLDCSLRAFFACKAPDRRRHGVRATCCLHRIRRKIYPPLLHERQRHLTSNPCLHTLLSFVCSSVLTINLLSNDIPLPLLLLFQTTRCSPKAPPPNDSDSRAIKIQIP